MIPVVIFSFLLRNSAESLHKGCRHTCAGERGVGLPVERKKRKKKKATGLKLMI